MSGSVALAMLGVVGDASALPDREWGTYVGGTGSEGAADVVFDSWNDLIVAGWTSSSAGMTTSGAFDTSFGGAIDGFISQWDQASGRIWSTYYGGSGEDYFRRVVVNGDDEIYAVGSTKSSSGVATSGAHQTTLSGTVDAMLVKFDDAGDPLWATYFGGPGAEDNASSHPSVCIGGDGSVSIVGSTTSTSQIATTGAHQTAKSGLTDATTDAWDTTVSNTDGLFASFNAAGALLYSSYNGGTAWDTTYGVASDASGVAVVVGSTGSSGSIATTGVFDTVLSGTSDAFITLIRLYFV